MYLKPIISFYKRLEVGTSEKREKNIKIRRIWIGKNKNFI
jgi:hypothetical protein